MDDEPLLSICCLAPWESQPKAETKILCLSIFVNRVPGQMVVVQMTGLAATSSFFGRATSNGVSIERLKLSVGVALGSTAPALAPSGSWIALDTPPVRRVG